MLEIEIGKMSTADFFDNDFTEADLRALIRDPAAVRHWPAQQMPGFNESALSDSDLNAVIAYLNYLAAQFK